MSDVVLDANVIVGLLDEGDTPQGARAHELAARLRSEGYQPVFVDFLLAEALSALCRRAQSNSSRLMVPTQSRNARSWLTTPSPPGHALSTALLGLSTMGSRRQLFGVSHSK
jgi:predicted nucleic acid-binding protein